MKIIVDSREQTPFKFRKSDIIEEVVVKALSAGDYSIEGYQDTIAIERKSGADLFGTIGKGNARFQRELERAINYDYFAIVIEEDYTAIRDKTFNNAFRCKMRGDVVLSILFTLSLKYGVHVYFCKNRNEATSLTRKILTNYYNWKNKTTSCSLPMWANKLKRKFKIK